MAGNRPPGGPDPLGWLRWAASTDRPAVRFVRDLVSSALAVLLVGALLFAISGVWPPMVAVESGSMEPHLHRGDLVFVMDEDRFVPTSSVGGTGIVTTRSAAASGYRRFGDLGDVIVYKPDGGNQTPIIHRARFWVDEGENWYPRADRDMVFAGGCEPTPNCPAPHAGFITKGDANPKYDQVSGISGPVRPAWIRGTAEARLPLLGYVRLFFSEVRGVATVTVETG